MCCLQKALSHPLLNKLVRTSPKRKFDNISVRIAEKQRLLESVILAVHLDAVRLAIEPVLGEDRRKRFDLIKKSLHSNPDGKVGATVIAHWILAQLKWKKRNVYRSVRALQECGVLAKARIVGENVAEPQHALVPIYGSVYVPHNNTHVVNTPKAAAWSGSSRSSGGQAQK